MRRPFPRVLSLRLTSAGTLLAIAAAVSAAPGRPSRQYTIEQFLSTIAVSGASFSADEKKILFSSNKTGVYNVYSVSTSGGETTPVTSSATDSVFAVGYFPKDDRVLYTHDQGGNELNHLYVKGPDGQERDLTPGEKLKAQFAGWRRSGDAFYVLTNERDARFFDLYRYDTASLERRIVYQDDKGYDFGDISEDGKWIALQKINSTSDSDIFLWSSDSNETKQISKHSGVADYNPAAFDPASKYLYYTTNDGSEFNRVSRYDLKTGKAEDVEKADWDIAWTFLSHDGKYRASGTNQDGRTVLKIYEMGSGRQVALPPLLPGEISSVRISRSEKRLAFMLDGDRGPNNLYVYDFGAQAPVRLTDTLSKDIDPEDLVESHVVRFQSFDGMVIPSIFYKPHQATAERKAPALVWVHGGPGGQTRQQYSATIQYLVNHGYVVLGINNRGSSGYGKSFNTADDRRHGREPLWDCVEGKKYLQSLPFVDPGRIGILGGSYGGYMVLAALAFKPEEFAVGVDIFGVANWIRTLESIPKWWEAERLALYKEIGDPVQDREMLMATSPLFHADQIRKPLIVLQGANDPRVIKPESDDIVAAVRKNHVPVEYKVFDDEGHGFTKRKNNIADWNAVLEFLDKYLKGAPAPGS